MTWLDRNLIKSLHFKQVLVKTAKMKELKKLDSEFIDSNKPMKFEGVQGSWGCAICINIT